MTFTILLADDQRGIRRFCKHELEADGYRVLLAQDGDEALSILYEEKVDLVILDAHMPGCSGIETAKHIKQANPELPVILFTLDTDFEGYHSRYIDRCIIKSGNLDELKDAIMVELWAAMQVPVYADGDLELDPRSFAGKADVTAH